jgi:M6 family metalloprotease-like protein
MYRRISHFILIALGLMMLFPVPSGSSWAQAHSRTTPAEKDISMPPVPPLPPEPGHQVYLPLAFKEVVDHAFPPINAAGVVDTFHARAEADLGLWSGANFPDQWEFFTDNEWATTSSQTWTDIHSYPRKMAANFVALADDTRIAIFFSAEVRVNEPNRRMFVRALIDGETSHPADIVLTTGDTSLQTDLQSFIFTDVVDRGLHTVEFQWQVDEGGMGLIRNAAFLIRQSSGQPLAEQTLTMITPESGHNLTNDQPDWVDIPGLNGKVYAQDGDTLIASISAESFVNHDGYLLIRALVDGVPALPANVILTRSRRRQSRSMTFGMYNIAGGTHVVRFQWASSGGQQATLGDRTMVLATGKPNNPSQTQTYFVASPFGSSDSTNSTDYSLIADMHVTGQFPANAEIAVIFSAETGPSQSASSASYLRLTINGQVVDASEVLSDYAPGNISVQSFVFDAKHITASQAVIQVEWRSTNGQTVIVGDRTMTVLVKPGAVPDLAEPPEIGGGNAGIEPVIGARNVLTVLWDPHRTDEYGVTIPAPAISYLEHMLFGSNHSMNDYYQRISGGKFWLQNAGILGPYDSLYEWEVYAGHYTPCGAPVIPPVIYRGGHQRKWAEALTAADDDFDFSAYDVNGDGVLDPIEELAIMIVIPTNTDNEESGYLRLLNPYCTEEPFIVDNVVIPVISENYLYAQNSLIGNFMLPTHELAHHILNLGDMYNTDFDIATEASALSLMADTFSDRTQHIDGPSKLALGWVDPQIISQNATVSLEDVKYSEEVILLPRLNGGDGKEYYLLENRRDSNDNPRYDENIADDGIAVWHVVEDSDANSALPNCVLAEWWNTIEGDNPRRGIRLIRPTADFNNVNALWDASDYDLMDTGLVCPPDDNPTNVLEWADGTPSGYNILNFSPPGQVMSFDVVAP